MSTPTEHNLRTRVDLAGFARVVDSIGVVVAHGIDVARYIPIPSMIVAGGIALGVVTRGHSSSRS